jgi:hypothetical protein
VRHHGFRGLAASRAAWRLAIAAAILAGLAAAAISTRTAPETYPVADTATTSIYTLRAARGELAVGSYSRFGWNHPGPLLYQVLALPYEASGRREIALKWTALALNLVWIAGTLAVVRRRSPRLMLAIGVALVPLLWREQRLLIFPWNPVAPVLALGCAIALAADLDARRRWTPALLVATLSFCVQAHLGLAVPALAIVVAAALALLTPETPGSGASNGKRPRGLLWPLGLAFGAGLVLWAKPLLHEVRDGNLAAMVRFLLDGTNVHADWSRALAAGTYMLAGPFLANWQITTGEIPHDLPSWLAWLYAILLAGTVLACVHAARRGERFEAAFAAICAAATLSVAIAAHGIVGPLSDYLLLWAAPIGALDVAVVLSAVASALPGRAAGSDRVLAGLAAAYVAAWAVVGAHRLTTKHAEQARDPTVRALSLDLRRYCETHAIARPVLGYAPGAWQEASGIVLQFDKADAPIAVTDDAVYLVGPPFARTGRERAAFYLMPVTGTLPADAGTAEWVTTRGAYRVVRLRAEAAVTAATPATAPAPPPR